MSQMVHVGDVAVCIWDRVWRSNRVPLVRIQDNGIYLAEPSKEVSDVFCRTHGHVRKSIQN